MRSSRSSIKNKQINKQKRPAKDKQYKTIYLSNSFYVEVLPFTTEEFLILLNHIKLKS